MSHQMINKNLNSFILYMNKRAVAEGTLFELDLPYLSEAFHSGIRGMFGVELDENAKMLNDAQEPKDGFFRNNA